MQQQMAMQQQMGGMPGTLIEAQIQSNQKLMGGMSEWASTPHET